MLYRMNSPLGSQLFGYWVALASIWAFALFGIDKARAKRAGANRISEFTLLLVSGLGGWPGGMLGLIFFRHKSSKFSFLLQFAVAFMVFALLVAAGLKFSGHG